MLRLDLYLIYATCFFIIIFICITINHIISLADKTLFFGHVCQKFSLSVLLRFCLIYCQFHPGFAYKSVAYEKSLYLLQRKQQYNVVHLTFPPHILPTKSNLEHVTLRLSGGEFRIKYKMILYIFWNLFWQFL